MNLATMTEHGRLHANKTPSHYKNTISDGLITADTNSCPQRTSEEQRPLHPPMRTSKLQVCLNHQDKQTPEPPTRLHIGLTISDGTIGCKGN